MERDGIPGGIGDLKIKNIVVHSKDNQTDAPFITTRVLVMYTISSDRIAELYSQWEILSLFIFMVILQVLGCFGNLLALLGFRKKATNLIFLIRQVSVVCLLECLWTITITYISVLNRGWVLPRELICITGYLDNSLYVCCVWVLVLSAIERYMSLRHPLAYRQLCKRQHIFKVGSLACWVLSFSFCSYPLIKNEFGFDRVTFTVGIVADGSVFFPMYFVATFALPLLIISAAYVEILRMSRQRIRMKRAIEQEHGLPMPSRKSDFRLAIMIILTYFNIAGTHIPVIIFIVTHLAGVNFIISTHMSLVVNIVLMMGFALQSYIFLATIKELQDFYKDFFCCHRVIRRGEENIFGLDLSLTYSTRSGKVQSKTMGSAAL